MLLNFQKIYIKEQTKSSFPNVINYYEHLLDSSDNLRLIKEFCVANESGSGLERYLKEFADAGEGYFYSISAVELSNFAENSSCRKNHPKSKNLGSTVFAEFILPFIKYLKTFVGIQAVYIYALPESKLIEHYKTMGFIRLDLQDEKFVHSHVKPKYDEGCIFMYQTI